MSTIHLVTSGNGNAGKSVFSAVLGYVIEKTCPGQLRRIDADPQKQTTSRMYKGTTQIALGDDPMLEDQADTAWTMAAEGNTHVVVDLAADTDIYINKWIDERGVVDVAADEGIRLVKWWIGSADPDSLRMLSKLNGEMPGLQHVLVKSYYNVREMQWPTALASVPTVSEALAGDLEEIVFPKLFGKLALDFREQSLSWEAIAADSDHQKVSRLNRAAVLRWLGRCEEQIKSVYDFNEKPAAKAPVKEKAK